MKKHPPTRLTHAMGSRTVGGCLVDNATFFPSLNERARR